MLWVLRQFSVAVAEQPTTANLRGIFVANGTDKPIAGGELALATFEALNPPYPRQSPALVVDRLLIPVADSSLPMLTRASTSHSWMRFSHRYFSEIALFKSEA